MILSSSLLRLSRSIFSSSRDKLYLLTKVSNISNTRTILNCRSDTSSPVLLIFNRSLPITYEISYTSSTVSSKASFSKARAGDDSSPNSMTQRDGRNKLDFFFPPDATHKSLNPTLSHSFLTSARTERRWLTLEKQHFPHHSRTNGVTRRTAEEGKVS